MTNAEKYVKFLKYPKDPKFAENIRQFQGCPTIAVTKGGRIFMGWYSGGFQEPHIDNYNLLIYSDDDGETWSEPVCIIEGSRELCYQALDIQLWIDPEGALNIFWCQNNVLKADDNQDPNGFIVEDYIFGIDDEHCTWVSKVDNPDADVLEFSEPRQVFPGFLRCKPLMTKSNRILYPAYSQNYDNYLFSISEDMGKTFTQSFGGKRLSTDCDEHMFYQKETGDLVMLARTKLDYLAKTISKDNGDTWSETTLSNIPNPMTRFYISRTPSGRIILVNNDHPGHDYQNRTNMTVYLSEDDGESWKYKKLIDSRPNISYPDVDFYDGTIYLTYDR